MSQRAPHRHSSYRRSFTLPRGWVTELRRSLPYDPVIVGRPALRAWFCDHGLDLPWASLKNLQARLGEPFAWFPQAKPETPWSTHVLLLYWLIRHGEAFGQVDRRPGYLPPAVHAAAVPDAVVAVTPRPARRPARAPRPYQPRESRQHKERREALDSWWSDTTYGEEAQGEAGITQGWRPW